MKNLNEMKIAELSEVYKQLNPKCKAKVLKTSKKVAIEMIEKLQKAHKQVELGLQGAKAGKVLKNIVKIDKHRLMKIEQFIHVNSDIQNSEFEKLKQFNSWCKFFKITSTIRQVSKFRNRRGLLYQKVISPNSNCYIN